MLDSVIKNQKSKVRYRKSGDFFSVFRLLVSGFWFLAPIFCLPAAAADLTAIQQNLLAKKEQDAALKKQLDKTEDDLAALRANLVKATRENQKSEAMLGDTQSRLAELERDEKLQSIALKEQESQLGVILSGLVRLSRTPTEILLLRPEQPVDNLRSGILLRYALPHYAQAAQKLSTQLKNIDETRAGILEKRKTLLETQKTLAAQQEELNKLLEQRQAWLKATENQRSDLQKEISRLSADAQNVQDLMSRVASVSSAMPTKALQKKAGKGIFIAPAKGQLVYGFGDSDDVGSQSRGVMLKVKSSAMIVAPADGQVVFAGPFKGYGNILILRHNNDYHSFLAGFGRVDSSVGQVVNAGEPLGRMPAGDAGSAQLYFELRRGGSPINPAQLVSLVSVAQQEKTASP